MVGGIGWAALEERCWSDKQEGDVYRDVVVHEGAYILCTAELHTAVTNSPPKKGNYNKHDGI